MLAPDADSLIAISFITSSSFKAFTAIKSSALKNGILQLKTSVY